MACPSVQLLLAFDCCNAPTVELLQAQYKSSLMMMKMMMMMMMIHRETYSSQYFITTPAGEIITRRVFFYSAPQCSHCKRCTSYGNSVCLSVRPSAVHPQGRPLSPKILAPSDLHRPDSIEFWHILPCSASTVRDRKRSPITRNKNSTRAFQRAINQGSMPPLTASKWG